MSNNPNPRPSRRNFLLAAPVAAAGAVALAGAGPATATPPRVYPHDPARARRGNCWCPRCIEDRPPPDPNAHLLADASVALTRLDNNLRRLLDEEEEDGWRDCGLHADALVFLLRYGISNVDNWLVGGSPLVKARLAEAAREDGGRPAFLACHLALVDALDSLLELTWRHCDDSECEPCEDSDALVYFLREARTLLGDGAPAMRAMVEREVWYAERKWARWQESCEAGERMMPHTAQEHLDSCRELWHHRKLLAIL
jgi:hypothetical protein